ncbi:hypothetical protein [Oscillatoria sp. FACHB-1406]|uniref:hypothetical protein n=1 Tax=Oscillatoria sp. FACHB-1406 TaxID=2692846 RepID=UPI0016827CBF|nr:hypothetical protein [Oscillatoria sp. FACHB-1406]MBD2577862.1 hypothetical protein [Oscillatoria sp. FACHB-1406]
MLKKFALLAFLICSGGFALGYYYWKQVTGVPQWYAAQQISSPVTSQTAVSSSPGELQAQKTEVIQKIERQIADQRSNAPQQDARVSLESQDLNDLIVSSIAEKPKGEKFLEATRGVQTKIEPEKLEVGAVVNLDRLDSEVLSGSGKAALEKVLQKFPVPSDREVYIGIEGVPTVENGRLKVDNNTRVKVGNVSLSIVEVAKQLSVPPEMLVSGINQKLENISVSELQLEKDRLVLKGALGN